MLSASYESAKPSDISLILQIKLLLGLLKVIISSIFESIPIFIKWIVQQFSPPPLKKVSGQLALITGGSAGIGRALAFCLAKEGCNIAIVNRNFEMGQKVAEEICKQFGVNAKAFKTDVSKNVEVRKLKEDVERTMGCVDILVNNAGLLALENSLLEGSDEDYQNIIDTNLTAYFWTTRAFLPGMMERRRGHILSISSLITKFTVASTVAYSTTKFGNLGFMETLYDELCFYGYDDCIKTTIVFPTFVATQKKHSEMVDSITDIPLEDVDKIGDMIVKGMLQNRRKFTVPPLSAIHTVVKWFPDEVMKKAKLSFFKEDKEKFMKLREIK